MHRITTCAQVTWSKEASYFLHLESIIVATNYKFVSKINFWYISVFVVLSVAVLELRG